LLAIFRYKLKQCGLLSRAILRIIKPRTRWRL